MTDERRIQELVDRCIAMLGRLVAFDSVSRNSNLPLIDFIESYLGGHGVACRRVPSPDGNKSNLLARIGPEAEGGIVLSGHTDVVPVDGQAWNTDPFVLTAAGDRLYGRGTSDMKSFIAAALALVPEFQALAPARPIWLAFSYDEEIGCLGAPHLLRHIEKNIPRPAYAIIGEPTMMKVVTAHKGVLSFETSVRGLEWHSSQPQLGVNAVQAACELVHFLKTLAGDLATAGKQDERFSPPYTTVHVGVIAGGTARNIIPRQCSFQWEIRPLPGDDADAIYRRFESRCKEVLQEMRAVSAQAAIDTRPVSRMNGVTLPAGAQAACQTVMRCARTNEELAVSFGTEAGVFNEHGVPAIVCGPGSIEQAHQPNEFIDIVQLRECVAFLLRLAGEITGDSRRE